MRQLKGDIAFYERVSSLRRFGITLSTKASYVYGFNQKNNLPEISALIGGDTELQVSPEIQGSLTLTWQIGKALFGDLVIKVFLVTAMKKQ